MDQWLNQSENGVKSESDPTFFFHSVSLLWSNSNALKKCNHKCFKKIMLISATASVVVVLTLAEL